LASIPPFASSAVGANASAAFGGSSRDHCSADGLAIPQTGAIENQANRKTNPVGAVTAMTSFRQIESTRRVPTVRALRSSICRSAPSATGSKARIAPTRRLKCFLAVIAKDPDAVARALES